MSPTDSESPSLQLASAPWAESPGRRVVHKVHKGKGHAAVFVLVAWYVDDVVKSCSNYASDGLGECVI